MHPRRRAPPIPPLSEHQGDCNPGAVMRTEEIPWATPDMPVTDFLGNRASFTTAIGCRTALHCQQTAAGSNFPWSEMPVTTYKQE